MIATIRMSRASRQPKFRCARAPKPRGERLNHRAAAPAGARRAAAGRRSPASMPQEADGLGHVVDAEDGRAGGGRGGERRERAGQPVGRAARPRATPENRRTKALREAPTATGKPERRATPPGGAAAARLPSGLLPKPRPGSMAIASGGDAGRERRGRPHRRGTRRCRRAGARTSRSFCIVRGSVPFMCMRMSAGARTRRRRPAAWPDRTARP